MLVLLTGTHHPQPALLMLLLMQPQPGLFVQSHPQLQQQKQLPVVSLLLLGQQRHQS